MSNLLSFERLSWVSVSLVKDVVPSMLRTLLNELNNVKAANRHGLQFKKEKATLNKLKP